MPKQTCHELFTHNHLASIFSSRSQSRKAPCDNGVPWASGQDQHFPTEQSCKEPHKQRVLQGFSLWAAGAGGVPGCQRGGCRRGAPVLSLCCPLFPRSQAASGSPRDKGRESWNYLGGKGPLKVVQSKPLQRAGTSSARSCCSKPHHGLACFQGRGMHHLSGQPESVFHHPHPMKFSPYI